MLGIIFIISSLIALVVILTAETDYNNEVSVFSAVVFLVSILIASVSLSLIFVGVGF